MRTIILYGNSLAVSSLGACLREREGLRVLPIATGLLSEARLHDAEQPDVVIFDLTATQPSFGVELLRAKPGLMLVGVDLASGKALVLSSHTSRALTTDDLVQVIESRADTAEESDKPRPMSARELDTRCGDESSPLAGEAAEEADAPASAAPHAIGGRQPAR